MKTTQHFTQPLKIIILMRFYEIFIHLSLITYHTHSKNRDVSYYYMQYFFITSTFFLQILSLCLSLRSVATLTMHYAETIDSSAISVPHCPDWYQRTLEMHRIQYWTYYDESLHPKPCRLYLAAIKLICVYLLMSHQHPTYVQCTMYIWNIFVYFYDKIKLVSWL